MNGREVLSRLPRRGLFRIKPGLDRMRKVMEALGDPQNSYPTIHISGTNGKGSVAASLESIFRVSGYRTGLYISPHLRELRERIQVQGTLISEICMEAAAREVAEAEERSQTHLTHFEFLTAMGFMALRTAKIDIGIIEVGLGGLWDATNVIDKPVAAVITSIGLEHMRWLGTTRTAIARQKAGIIKCDIPVISGVRGKAARVIQKDCAKKRAKLLQIDRDFHSETVSTLWQRGQQRIRYSAKGTSFSYSYPLLGSHQSDNSALVVTTALELRRRGWRIDPANLAAGLQQVVWPGRFYLEKGERRASILYDGAHNPPSMERFIETFKNSPWGREKVTLVFSSYADKDYHRMARMLAPFVENVFVCRLPGSRGVAARKLAETFLSLGVAVTKIQDPKEALHRALQETLPTQLVLVTGSLALVGIFMKERQFSSPKINRSRSVLAHVYTFPGSRSGRNRHQAGYCRRERSPTPKLPLLDSVEKRSRRSDGPYCRTGAGSHRDHSRV